VSLKNILNTQEKRMADLKSLRSLKSHKILDYFTQVLGANKRYGNCYVEDIMITQDHSVNIKFKSENEKTGVLNIPSTKELDYFVGEGWIDIILSRSQTISLAPHQNGFDLLINGLEKGAVNSKVKCSSI
jgi:hypothetical protein